MNVPAANADTVQRFVRCIHHAWRPTQVDVVSDQVGHDRRQSTSDKGICIPTRRPYQVDDPSAAPLCNRVEFATKDHIELARSAIDQSEVARSRRQRLEQSAQWRNPNAASKQQNLSPRSPTFGERAVGSLGKDPGALMQGPQLSLIHI